MTQMKFFKGCLPQILLGPHLNILTHIIGIVFISTFQGFNKYYKRPFRKNFGRKFLYDIGIGDNRFQNTKKGFYKYEVFHEGLFFANVNKSAENCGSFHIY